jgi:hypothetical protein
MVGDSLLEKVVCAAGTVKPVVIEEGLHLFC